MDELWLDKPFSNKFHFYSHKLDKLWLDKPFSNLPKNVLFMDKIWWQRF